MKFKVKTLALSSVLQRIAAAVEEKPALPAYAGVKIEVVGDRMVLSTLSAVISTEVHIGGVQSEGDIGFGLNLKLFSEVVMSLPNDDLTVEVGDTAAKLKTTRSNFKLPLLDDAASLPGANPPLSARNYSKLDLLSLVDAFAKVSYCHNDRSEKSFYRAVCIDKDNIVSTDGYRLSYVPNKACALTDGIILLTTPSVEKLTKIYAGMDGEAGVGSDGHSLFLHAGGVYTSTRLLSGSYPAYQTVLPKSAFAPVTLARKLLLESLKRVLVMSGEGIKHVNMMFSAEGLMLSCADGKGNSEDFLPIQIPGLDTPGHIIVNGDFIQKAVSKMSAEKITIEYRPLGAIVITDGEHVNVLQPIRRPD